MDFTAIVVSRAREAALRSMLGQLRYQTRPPDETLVFCADTPNVARLREDFPEAEFLEREAMGDWGHTDRAEGVSRAAGGWLGFFNDDDTYDRRYLELMMKAALGGAQAVWCGWTGRDGNPAPAFRLGQSTAGNFIVRADIAREAGYTARDYAADGQFINRVAQLASATVFVPEVLYHHE